jgi:hypothetical protein
MTKLPKKVVPKALRGGTSYAMDRHHRIVREMPKHVEQRMQNVAARNEILNSADAYSALLERDRVTAHLHNMAPGLQRVAALNHTGELDAKMHRLANKGLPVK